MAITNQRLRWGIASLAVCVLLGAQPLLARLAHAQGAQVLVTVNDQPITTYDVRQRIALWKVVGSKPASGDLNKRALDELIDDVAEIEESRRRGIAPTESDIDKRLESIAKSLKTDGAGLKGKLKGQGIAISAMRQYIAAQFAFNRLIRSEGEKELVISDADIQKRTAKFKSEIDANINKQIAKLESDPRRRPITIYQLLEVSFPLDDTGGEITPQIIQSRALEVNTFLSRFKGCGSARDAARGIFNVKIGKTISADASKLPKPLKEALDSAKPGKALGPIRREKALQALGFCGVRTVAPAKIKRPDDIRYPTAEQVRSVIEQEKLAELQNRYRGKWRKNVLIEYRDPDLNQ
jgi:peptidyl-prolyl cis-trans isomerase SurA